MKHSCENCRFYNLNTEIKDERGKHECYGHSLICTPINFGYGIDTENDCAKFKKKDGTRIEEIQKEFRERLFVADKSTDVLVKAMMKRKMEGD